ncbi:Re/Si-specific NAD(P)(+) transhydrogenase subunit alpha [Thalassospiraceae bacterium LMO-SO8]|nr:Re/Si-specific NAD(P)(+) transhydrogenase subunit alpha [Alphaproteobacteria bacterium LMO-S08]WND75056.1 Re/Si-specific NAD(P)(+) transhydrogenase subunit alpha [Thalassospiraceae bacterium LMO-SO8]
MKIVIPKETRAGETRVAASPQVIQKLVALGYDVAVEKGAGEGASVSDDVFKAAGASIATGAAVKTADIVLMVNPPATSGADALPAQMKKGAVLISQLAALTSPDDVAAYAKAGITTFAMELVPRISRAQSMDVLSSQANLAGYRAILEAAAEYGRGIPMMMTAAGTVPPAKAFIMGVGVAGLQAIATAKRLGAVVTATDVRPATKEQVESLGGKFLVVDPEMEKDAQTEGGYAKEMPKEYYDKQKQVVAEHIKKQDIVVTTALIPGRPAPRLITKEMVASMQAGAVIVDLAVEAGGNCELSEPGKTITTPNGVKIVGLYNLPGRLAQTASDLYAKNLLNFLTPLTDKEKTGTLAIDWDDEIVKGCCVTRDGAVVNTRVKEAMGAKAPAEKKAPAKKAAAKKPADKPAETSDGEGDDAAKDKGN